MESLQPSRWFFRPLIEQPRWFALWLALLRSLFGLRTVGTIPKGKPLLFAANHGSYYDGWFLMTVLRESTGEWPAMVGWRGMWRYAITRQLLLSKSLRVILAPENRGTPEGRATICWEMIRVLQEGQSVCVHPEGLVLDRLGSFEPGTAFTALETGTPIVPVTLHGVQSLWKNVAFPRRFWGRVTIHFHAPVDPADYRHLPSREAMASITAEVRKRVASTLDYPDDCPTPVPA